MDSRRDFTSKKVFPGHFSELGEKANSALALAGQGLTQANFTFALVADAPATPQRSPRSVSSVSYTHLTLPTNREV